MARKDVSGDLLFDKVRIRGADLTAELEGLLTNLKIDPNVLGEEASDHASLFARWAILSEEASAETRFLKRDRDLLMADMDGKVRRDIETAGEKVTEAKVSREIEAAEAIVEATEKLAEAERAAGILGAIRQALVHRREMIAELMRNQRREWDASERSV